MRSETGVVEVDGARLYCEIAGSGEPLVFVHGYTLDSRMWDDQFAHFAQSFRVLRYDVRGFGRSDLPTAAPFSNHADLRALLDHFGFERAHVCGLSMGGGITIDFALEYPNRVRSVVLIGSALGGFKTDWGALGPTMAAVHAAAHAGDLPEARRLWLECELFAPAARIPSVAARLREMVDSWSGWQLTNRANHVDPVPLPVQRVAELVAPTLVVVGELDSRGIHEIAVAIERTAANARRVVIPDVGHMTNMEAPDAVNDCVTSFLRGVRDS